MKATLLLIALIPLAYGSITPGGRQPLSKKLADRYIVKFKRSVPPNTAQNFLESFNSRLEGVEADRNKIIYTYNRSFNGFSGKFSPEFIRELRRTHADSIEYIEEDKIAHIFGPIGTRAPVSQPDPPSWSLRRISQRALNLQAPYRYQPTAGEGVEAWIVDTGCDPKKGDFEGRAVMAKSFVEGEEEIDLNGHGTHVAGTVAGKKHGVAKKATIKCVKVLDAEGSGTYAGVIAGVDYVTSNVKAGKTVMNMSLGGPTSQALNDAIVAAIKAGVVVIVAAGNESSDACNVSPAGASGVLAVGATDKNDNLADYSNVGKCVGILAPGTDVTSLWIGSEETATISGTSMATPHVVGVAALLMGMRSFPQAKSVYAELKRLATAALFITSSLH